MQPGARGVRQGPRKERGQILVLFTMVLVVILGITALVVDLGLLRNNRQSLANAMDAGAQAGGTMMPVDGSAGRPVGAPTPADVEALVNAAVARTYPGLQTPGNYSIGYKCLIGVRAGNPVAFDSADIDAFIPLDCDPSSSHGSVPLVGDFTGAGPTRSIDCFPFLGDRCNVIVLSGNVTTEYSFARVMGVDRGNTGQVTSAACQGLCGELPNDRIRRRHRHRQFDEHEQQFLGRSDAHLLGQEGRERADRFARDRTGGRSRSGPSSTPATTVHPPRPSYFRHSRQTSMPCGARSPRCRATGAPRRSSKAWPWAPRPSRPTRDRAPTHVLVFVSDGRANPDTILDRQADAG